MPLKPHHKSLTIGHLIRQQDTFIPHFVIREKKARAEHRSGKSHLSVERSSHGHAESSVALLTHAAQAQAYQNARLDALFLFQVRSSTVLKTVSDTAELEKRLPFFKAPTRGELKSFSKHFADLGIRLVHVSHNWKVIALRGALSSFMNAPVALIVRDETTGGFAHIAEGVIAGGGL